MAQSPSLPAGPAADISVAPSRIDLAAATVSALGAAVSAAGPALRAAITGRGAAAVGDPGAGAALVEVARLLDGAVDSAGDGVAGLARAMGAATGAYRLADTSAVWAPRS